VVGLGFKSANDCCERDPDEVLVEYVPVGAKNLVKLDNLKLDF